MKSWDPAFSTLLRGGQAFNVRTADAWWKRCVDLLVWSSDVVVIDVSRVKTGTAWELNELSKRGLLENAVLIAEQSKDLRDFDHIIKELTNKAPLEVFRYSEKGRMLLSGQFKSLFEGRILNAVDSWSSPHAE